MQPKYIFVRASVNSWKEKAEKYENQNDAIMHKIGRSNLVEDKLLTKVKDVVTRVRMAGGAISNENDTRVWKLIVHQN